MLAVGYDSRSRSPTRCNRCKRARLSRTVRERPPGSRVCRPCGETPSVGNFRTKQSSNVESRQRAPAASHVLSSHDGPTVQFSSGGARGPSQRARKGKDGHHWSGDAEAPAYLLQGPQIRPSLRSIAASWDLICLTHTTPSVLIFSRADSGRCGAQRRSTAKRTIISLESVRCSYSWSSRRHPLNHP